MKRSTALLGVILFTVISMLLPFRESAASASEGTSQGLKELILDEAALLTEQEKTELNLLANEYSGKWETDIMVVTTDGPDAYDVERMTQDFYDSNGPGYDKVHGNTVILMINMTDREIYVAGFYKGEEYVDNSRTEQIKELITPAMAQGDYRLAVQQYLDQVDQYMGTEPYRPDYSSGSGSGSSSGISSGSAPDYVPSDRYSGSRSGVDPDSLLLNPWIQLGAAVLIGGLVVFTMVHRSGGRITINARTYQNGATSGVLSHEDNYLHTTRTSRKIESNNNRSGGGGGTTSGGHSHSGSRGSF